MNATGTELILAERVRQISEEGYSPEHDDSHGYGALARAAACYALRPTFSEINYPEGDVDAAPILWPWASGDWKPTPNDRIRELVKAGALIAAEIDRLQRPQDRRGTTPPPGLG